MARRERTVYQFNGREFGRFFRRMVGRGWRGFLVHFAYTNPDDTRLDPHISVQELGIHETIDRVVLQGSVLAAIVRGARNYPSLETGEALVGVVLPDDAGLNAGPSHERKQTVYVLGTIAPDESTIREWGTVQMGDEDQYEQFLWLAENWDEDHRHDEIWGRCRLQHLGDWHKHPSHMTSPSQGDFHSAKALLNDERWLLPFILQPIVTLHESNGRQSRLFPEPNCIHHEDEDGFQVRIDFWYLHPHSREYESLADIQVVDLDAGFSIPDLAPLPWNLRDRERWQYETFCLQADQRMFQAIYHNTDGIAPLEYCLLMPSADGQQLILVATQFDHPAQPPVIWSLPLHPSLESEHLDERIHEAWPSRRLLAPMSDGSWNPEASLSAYLNQFTEISGTRI